MSLNSKGFFLVELYLSLAIWLFIGSGLVPVYIHLSKQSISLKQELEATHLLYETLSSSVVSGTSGGEGLVVRNNFTFTIDEHVEADSLEVCISFENPFKEEFRKCEYVEQ
ncbi:hypothetical protein ACFYKX_17995 [Cytobacillus sp. FJAT-54145]|uniref:Uncharacterized protein n=1 Tax=Cytobacillus spartinae TaxID=3299023 RepID=A0ABW6KE93_9BACI